jgi:hypothetical protein
VYRARGGLLACCCAWNGIASLCCRASSGAQHILFHPLLKCMWAGVAPCWIFNVPRAAHHPHHLYVPEPEGGSLLADVPRAAQLVPCCIHIIHAVTNLMLHTYIVPLAQLACRAWAALCFYLGCALANLACMTVLYGHIIAVNHRVCTSQS